MNVVLSTYRSFVDHGTRSSVSHVPVLKGPRPNGLTRSVSPQNIIPKPCPPWVVFSTQTPAILVARDDDSIVMEGPSLACWPVVPPLSVAGPDAAVVSVVAAVSAAGSD